MVFFNGSADYHLLEEILRHSESARRFRTPFNAKKLELNNGSLTLKKQAQKRRINLVFLPRGMTKRVENSSWYYQRLVLLILIVVLRERSSSCC